MKSYNALFVVGLVLFVGVAIKGVTGFHVQDLGWMIPIGLVASTVLSLARLRYQSSHDLGERGGRR